MKILTSLKRLYISFKSLVNDSVYSFGRAALLLLVEVQNHTVPVRERRRIRVKDVDECEGQLEQKRQRENSAAQTQKKSLFQCHFCPPQSPHGLVRDQTRASAQRCRRLTARAKTPSFKHKFQVTKMVVHIPVHGKQHR